MGKIYTIGFTKKTAEDFFTLLENNHVRKLIDVRLNNTSQLAAFSNFPDIEFFFKKICSIEYFHDTTFAPTEDILSDYKKKIIDWTGYEIKFAKLMGERDIDKYIAEHYSDCNNYCLLCSEPTPEKCHRRLVAEKFSEVLKKIEIIHL